MLTYHSACVTVLACLAAISMVSGAFAEDLSLRDAIDIAISNNPTVAAGQLAAQASAESARGARALANPEITAAPSVLGDAGSDSAILFSQPLETNGSRRSRGKIASHEASAASLDAAALARDVALRVSISYWDVAQAQQLVRLSEESVSHFETILAAVQKQYDVGAVPGAQVTKMEVELAGAKQELARARLGLSQSRIGLNALLNWPVETVCSASDPLTSRSVSMDQNALRNAALSKRPELASAQSQLSAAQERIDAARLLRMPDLAIQARKESFRGGSDSGVAVAVTLPLWDWGSARAEKRSAEAMAESQQKRLEAIAVDVVADVARALGQVQAADLILREYESGILDQSEQLAAMAAKGYEKGAGSYLELLEAQRTLRAARSSYYIALTDHAKALAQLEWAIGCPIESVSDTEVTK